jgi:hypothetical protein
MKTNSYSPPKPAQEATPKKDKSFLQVILFIVSMWALSRTLIVISIQIISPLLALVPGPFVDSDFVAEPGWALFAHWDGYWYRKIATEGYDYLNDGKQHSIAFFPLYPLLCRLLSLSGLSFEAAGVLLNSFAFLGALFVIYKWIEKDYDPKTAKVVILLMVWCPYSLYGTVVYTEGVFLLCTTSALRAFEQRQYFLASLWGIASTFSRVPGVTVPLACMISSWRENRGIKAYISSFSMFLGIISYSLFCAVKFGDALAFWRVQKAWGHSNFINGWAPVFAEIISFNFSDLSSYINALLRTIIFFGGIYLMWRLRRVLPPILVSYGFLGLGLLMASGAVHSVPRYCYGIVSLSVGLGLTLRKSRIIIKYGLLLVFALGLTIYSIRFAWGYWVA